MTFSFCRFLLFMALPLFAWADLPYCVRFEGVSDPETLSLLKAASQLVTLQDQPPASETALAKRAETDLLNIVAALHDLAYYDAEVTFDIYKETDPAIVMLYVSIGPIYPLSSFKLLPSCPEEPGAPDLASISLADLDIDLGTAARPRVILEAESTLQQCLAAYGYPLATVDERTVVADQAAKTVSVTFHVTLGPLARFGETLITGNTKVRDAFIRNKISWRYGGLYDPEEVACTFNALDRTHLFTSIDITEASELDEDGLLPMQIDVTEACHRSIGLGATFATQQGAGVLGEWEHRNIRGYGERLTLKTEIIYTNQLASASYLKPDFLCVDQDLLTSIGIEREVTKGFREVSSTLSARLQRRFSPELHGSAGVAMKYLYSTQSDNNRHFFLTQLPLQLLWNTANFPLDPTKGTAINLRLVPTRQWISPPLAYLMGTLDASLYFPLGTEALVLAGKVRLGSIMGASLFAIPPPERFYAGCANTLRGYRYLTVSPLDADNKPIGGRSIMVYSFELRGRIGAQWGVVGFYEIGNVYASIAPQFTHKQLRSVGFGIRYFTPVGPLRFDLAFPLDRRKGVDASCQFYFSIGQTF